MRPFRFTPLVLACVLAASFIPAVQPALAAHAVPVTVDVRPGSPGATTVPLGSAAMLPVAILSAPDFDARLVVPASVCFGDPDDATQRSCDGGRASFRDVDGDGRADLLLRFRVSETGLDAEDAQACLEGDTTDGHRVHGCDAIRAHGGTPEAQLPDLAVQLAATPADPAAGAVVEWTATVVNQGSGGVTVQPGVALVSFTLDAGLTGASILGVAGYACSAASAVAWSCAPTAPDTLAPGDARVATLQATVPTVAGPVGVVARADPDAAVGEADEANNEASASVVVTPRLPDLAIAIAGTPDPVDALTASTWPVVITNVGTSPAELAAGVTLLRLVVPTSFLNLALSGPPASTCFLAAAGVIECQTTSAVSLAGGATLDFTLFATVPRTPGVVDVTATADPFDGIAEEDEANNAATAAITVQPPDLSITLGGAPDPVDALSSSTWTARIMNDGPAVARISSGMVMIRLTVPTSFLNLAVSAPPGHTCFLAGAGVVECQTTATSTLAVGDALDFTLFGTVPRAPGPVDVTAAADPHGLIPEADETDNEATATITVQPPDLSITLTGASAPVDALSSTTWVARITNDGPANARISSGMGLIQLHVPTSLVNLAVSAPPGFTCFLAGAGLIQCDTTSTTNLAAGSTLEFSLFGTVPRTPGPLDVTATADPLGLIPELDETDNAAVATIVVQPPDLSIAVTASPDPVDAQSSSTWVARITNDGPANARISTSTSLIRFDLPASLLNLAVSAPSGFTCFLAGAGVVECQTTATTNLPAGGTLDFSLFATAPRTPGPLTVTVTADPSGLIPEVDETDNQAAATITVQPPDLSLALQASPDPVAPGGATTWVATLTNDGPAGARLSSGVEVLRFTLPAGLTNLAAVAPAGWSCVLAATDVVACSPTSTQTLAVGDSVVVTLTADAPVAPGPLTVMAAADEPGTIPEADETDNAASASITVA